MLLSTVLEKRNRGREGSVGEEGEKLRSNNQRWEWENRNWLELSLPLLVTVGAQIGRAHV